MKQFQKLFLLLTLVVILSGFKKNHFDNNISVPGSAQINIADVKVVEGNAGPKRVQVIVTISGERSEPATVKYNTKDGTASSVAGSDYVAASGIIDFAKDEMVKRIIVSINGERAVEADENFEILLSSPSGAGLARESGKVIILNDDFSPGNVPASVFGGIGTVGANISGNIPVYEVRFTFTGYVTLAATNPDCGVRSNGTVVLTGLLAGKENVEDDDDINYRGNLQMDMDIDLCSVMRLTNGEDRICAITVIGSGPVNAELEIKYDARGGYMKIEHTSGLFLKNCFGSCDHDQINEETDMVPNRTIASIFNGYELPMLTNRTLTVGRYVVTGDMGETVVEVLRKLN
jgi:hypothetical protein